MSAKYLTWIFVALAAVFGIPALSVDSVTWQRVLGSLGLLFLSGFALAMVYDAVETGRLRVRYAIIERHRQPYTFWSAVTIISAAGVIVLVGAVWMAFFKGR